jgi:hypothetical protein
MNRLATLADVSVLVCPDANVMLAPGAPCNAERHLAADCFYGRLRYAGAMAALYWRFEKRIKQLQTDTDSPMSADAVRAAAIETTLALLRDRQRPWRLVFDARRQFLQVWTTTQSARKRADGP